MSKKPGKRNRRVAARRLPRPCTKATCVANANGVRRDVGIAILDLSVFGAQFLVTAPLSPGSDVAVGLEGESQPPLPLLTGKVVWCVPFDDDAYRIGMRFQQNLRFDLLQELCDAEAPASTNPLR
jgi:hypothetical protein